MLKVGLGTGQGWLLHTLCLAMHNDGHDSADGHQQDATNNHGQDDGDAVVAATARVLSVSTSVVATTIAARATARVCKHVTTSVLRLRAVKSPAHIGGVVVLL